mmetsp:Transcript_20862/g.46610  ORF Transcript_20862/g.46610 Transcript_20862/m.46610 type:complete len:205 (-) Transcript_20862:107-721(-)
MQKRRPERLAPSVTIIDLWLERVTWTFPFTSTSTASRSAPRAKTRSPAAYSRTEEPPTIISCTRLETPATKRIGKNCSRVRRVGWRPTEATSRVEARHRASPTDKGSSRSPSVSPSEANCLSSESCSACSGSCPRTKSFIFFSLTCQVWSAPTRTARLTTAPSAITRCSHRGGSASTQHITSTSVAATITVVWRAKLWAISAPT